VRKDSFEKRMRNNIELGRRRRWYYTCRSSMIRERSIAPSYAAALRRGPRRAITRWHAAAVTSASRTGPPLVTTSGSEPL